MALERRRRIILDRSGYWKSYGRAKDHQDRAGKTQLSECTVFHYGGIVMVAWKRSPVAVPGRDRRFRQSHPTVSCSPCHVHHKSVGGRLLKTRPWPATRKRYNLPDIRLHHVGRVVTAFSLSKAQGFTCRCHGARGMPASAESARSLRSHSRISRRWDPTPYSTVI